MSGRNFSDKRSVAVVTPVYAPYRAGMARVAEEDVMLMSGCEDVREVAVYAPSTMRPLFSYGNAAFLPQLFLVARKHDVVFLHYPFFGGAVWTALGALVFRKKMIVIFHMDAVADDWRNVVFRVWRAMFQSLVMCCATRVVVSSMDYVETSSLGRFVARENARVRRGAAGVAKMVEVPLVVDTTLFSPGEKSVALMQRYGFDVARDRVVMFLGALDEAHKFKGLEVLFTAMQKMDRDSGGRRVCLLVCGGGSLLSYWQSRAREMGIADRVVFAGRVSDEELSAHYRLADVFAFPSTSRAEAFGLVALEAMSSGVPVVASALPGVRSVVGVDCGAVVEPGNAELLREAMSRLLNDEALREQCGLAALARVFQKYSKETRRQALKALL